MQKDLAFVVKSGYAGENNRQKESVQNLLQLFRSSAVAPISQLCSVVVQGFFDSNSRNVSLILQMTWIRPEDQSASQCGAA